MRITLVLPNCFQLTFPYFHFYIFIDIHSVAARLQLLNLQFEQTRTSL
jgi:hypothetical protein